MPNAATIVAVPDTLGYKLAMFELLVAIIALVPIGWSHHLIAAHTRYEIVTRGLLIVVGLGFGAICMRYALDSTLARWSLFVAGMGAVHTPAAIVLTIKQLKRRGY